MFFAQPLQRSNLCASHRQRRWLTYLSYEGLCRWNDAVGAYQRYLDLAPASPTTTALKWHVVAIMENQERARAGG